MHHAQPVRLVQAIEHLREDLHGGGGRQRPFLEALLERLTLDELHREEELALGGLSEVEHADDVRVLEPGDELGLALEAAPHVGVGREGAPEQLERDGALQVHVLGAVDIAHATAGEVGLDAEAAVDEEAGLKQLARAVAWRGRRLHRGEVGRHAHARGGEVSRR